METDPNLSDPYGGPEVDKRHYFSFLSTSDLLWQNFSQQQLYGFFLFDHPLTQQLRD